MTSDKQVSKGAITAMKRTPVSTRFAQQLIDVNDQVCFSALRQWEFEQTLATLVASRPSDFTPDVFPSNPFAESIYRKVGDLPIFLQASEQVALKMGVIASVEYCIAYLEEVQTFRQVAVPGKSDTIKDPAEEQQLRLKIESWSGKPPVPGYFRTLGYLRLLRNHYAHVNTEPHKAFSAHISSYATMLNKFWDNGFTDLHGINFKTLHSAPLTPDLAFGIMNVLRVCLRHVDQMVAETFTLSDAVRMALAELFKSPGNRQLKIERIASKVSGRLTNEWNINEKITAVTNEVQKLLAS